MHSTTYDRRLHFSQAVGLAAPHSWPSAIFPALFGILYCWLRGLPLRPLQAGFLMAAVIAMQSAVNTLNDYHDFVKGADTEDDHVEASDSVLVYTGLDPVSARRFGILCLLAGACFGLAAAAGRGIVPILIGAAGALVVCLYSGGPLPLSYLPFGEVVSGTVMGGMIPLGIAACADGNWHPDILFYSLPLIVGIGLVMMSNNGCDIEKDHTSGRKTLPVCLGRKRTLGLYRTLIVIWLFILTICSLVVCGLIGLITPVIVVIFGRKVFLQLFKMTLAPEGRIRQMKTILAANICCGSAYAAAMLIRILLGAFYG